MRLAYADPPYPGKAHLYPENTEVDHVALIGQTSIRLHSPDKTRAPVARTNLMRSHGAETLDGMTAGRQRERLHSGRT